MPPVRPTRPWPHLPTLALPVLLLLVLLLLVPLAGAPASAGEGRWSTGLFQGEGSPESDDSILAHVADSSRQLSLELSCSRLNNSSVFLRLGGAGADAVVTDPALRRAVATGSDGELIERPQPLRLVVDGRTAFDRAVEFDVMQMEGWGDALAPADPLLAALAGGSTLDLFDGAARLFARLPLAGSAPALAALRRHCRLDAAGLQTPGAVMPGAVMPESAGRGAPLAGQWSGQRLSPDRPPHLDGWRAGFASRSGVRLDFTCARRGEGVTMMLTSPEMTRAPDVTQVVTRFDIEGLEGGAAFRLPMGWNAAARGWEASFVLTDPFLVALRRGSMAHLSNETGVWLVSIPLFGAEEALGVMTAYCG